MTDAEFRRLETRVRNLEANARIAPVQKSLPIPDAGKPSRVLLIGSALAGIGYYDAGTITGGTGIDVAANFTAGAIAGGGESVVFAHLLEIDTDGTDDNLSLTSGTLGFGTYVGMSNEDPPRKVYAGYAFKGKNCQTTPDEGEV